jgi:hypothetical protein
MNYEKDKKEVKKEEENWGFVIVYDERMAPSKIVSFVS